jgi:histidinol-phosphatase (PHP family)
MMNYNYHTHTYRCSHASGTPEEYIVRAIDNGVKYMGFSDHAPFTFPDGYEAKYRVPTSEARDYIKEISELREKYKEYIDIKIGFEMEYYPHYFDTMLKNVIDFGAEYLIHGQHFLYEEHPNGQSVTQKTDKVEDLCAFVECVLGGMKTGVFTYVAHPDFITFVGDPDAYDREMRKICIASKENNIPLEINFLGIRDHRVYPNERFLKLAAEAGSPMVFGFDAHGVGSAYDGESLEKAKALVEKYKLNYIGMPEIKSLR